jgi:hypothetical protein
MQWNNNYGYFTIYERTSKCIKPTEDRTFKDIEAHYYVGDDTKQ